MMAEKPYHHGNLKEALIQAGLDILEEKGLAGLTLRACAIKAGSSHTAPKNHFGNLAGLQTAIAARGYARLYEKMTKGVPLVADNDAGRSRAFAGYVEFAVEEPGLFELMFARQRTQSDDPDLLAEAGKCFEVLGIFSSGLIWEGADAPNAETRSQIMHWSLVHGFAQLKMSGKLSKDGLKDLDIFSVLPDFQYKR
jgi:AcrR family transcriptional regulator